MKNSFLISVKEPCTEKFEDFASTAQGGFCASCQKEVIDFTKHSDEALRQFFDKNTGKTCGRFKKSQVKEVQTIPFMNTNFFTRSIGLVGFSLVALCVTPDLKAQEAALVNSTIRTEISGVQRFEASGDMAFEQYTVTGTVLDEENLPLPGVNVVLKGTAEGTQTDFDGKFEFPIPLEADDILVISYIGYGKKEYTITPSESETIDITIRFDLSDIELMGEVVVGGAYKSKRNIFQKFLALFKK